MEKPKLFECGQFIWYVFYNGFNHKSAVVKMKVDHIGHDYMTLIDPARWLRPVRITKDTMNLLFWDYDEAEKYREKLQDQKDKEWNERLQKELSDISED